MRAVSVSSLLTCTRSAGFARAAGFSAPRVASSLSGAGGAGGGRRWYSVAELGLAANDARLSRSVFHIDSGSFRLIVLNREKALHSLNLEMIAALDAVVAEAERRPDIAAMAVVATGAKAFCAGGDVRALYDYTIAKREKLGSGSSSGSSGGSGGGGDITKQFFFDEYRLNQLLSTLRKPYIAIVDGITMGGGCGISVNGRYRVATENTTVAMPETAIGFFPDVGGGHFLPRLKYQGFPQDGEAVGRFLGLTGFRLKGADVYHVGLATHFTAASTVNELVAALKAAGTAGKLNAAKVDELLNGLTAKATLGSCSLTPHLGVIRSAFSASTLEEVFRLLQKAAEGTDAAAAAFASQQLATLRRVSPTALRVTLAHLLRGRSQSLSSVLSEEYRMTQRFMGGHDFFEGVGAVLVRKDNKPQWKPANIQDVSEQDVNKYFAPLPADTQELLF